MFAQTWASLASLLVAVGVAANIPAQPSSLVEQPRPFSPGRHEPLLRAVACQSSACPARSRPVHTIRASLNATDDISEEFEQGLRRANGGGVLRLEAGKTYVIGKVLRLDWLRDVHLQLEGTIKFTDDISYWQRNHVSHPFQRSISFWQWGGSDVRIFGGGIIDGSGQKWWDGFAKLSKDATSVDNSYLRPVLFFAQDVRRLQISGIHFRNAPMWNSFFANSSDIHVDGCSFVAKSTTPKVRPKNSDGFDIYNVNEMRISNCILDVDDDCVSAKPNTTNLLVENLRCQGTHGISMGSIGQYPGTADYISNVLVRNVTLVDGTVGVRLKAWAGRNVGYGSIRNVTYRYIRMRNVDQPIVLDQCYFGVSAEECRRYPSKVAIQDIHFVGIAGTSSGKKRGIVGTLKCSQGAICKNIELRDIHLRGPPGSSERPVIHCDGIQNVTAGSCVGSHSRANARSETSHATQEHRSKSAQGKSIELRLSVLSWTIMAIIASIVEGLT